MNQSDRRNCDHRLRATGWPVTHVQSFYDGLKNLAVLQNKIRIAVLTLDPNVETASRFITEAGRLAAVNGIECPRLLALSQISCAPEIADRFERLGRNFFSVGIQRDSGDNQEVRWQTRIIGLPTIVIQRRAGHVAAVKVRYQASVEDLKIGPRLRSLAEYLAIYAKTEHSAEMIADALGVCRQSVKEYLLRLRRAFDQIRQRLRTSMRGCDVLWTRRAPGGYVYGFRANREIEDLEEFHDIGAELDDSAVRMRLCKACSTWNPRAETTWSHLGWRCLDCCRQFAEAGEQ